MTRLIGLPNPEEALCTLLLPYKPEDMDQQRFERDVAFIYECTFMYHKVDLTCRKVKHPNRLSDVQFMCGRNEELAEVNKKYIDYLLAQASQLIDFLSSAIHQFGPNKRAVLARVSLPEIFFKFYQIGPDLLELQVESNSTNSIMRIYSSPVYGQYREFDLKQ